MKSFGQIKKEIIAGKYQPVYFLHGQEEYLIDSLMDAIDTNVLEPHQKDFNQMTFYGKEVQAEQVIDFARRLPMMSPYQVILLKEAQSMRDLSALESYLDAPSKTTILAIAHKHKKIDMRTKFASKLKSSAEVFEAKSIKEDKVRDWITDLIKQKGVQIQPEALEVLAEFLGSDLTKLSSAINKLSIGLAPNSTITADQVKDQVGVDKQFNIFELYKSLSFNDQKKTQQIVSYFMNNMKSNPLVMIIGGLYGYFQKIFVVHGSKGQSDSEIASAIGVPSFFLREYKVAAKQFNMERLKNIFGLLKEYDLKSKGVGASNPDQKALLQELMFKIMR